MTLLCIEARRPPHLWLDLSPLTAVMLALLDAGLALRLLHEHDGVLWPMFRFLVQHPDGMFRWRDQPWLPLSLSLAAEKPR